MAEDATSSTWARLALAPIVAGAGLPGVIGLWSAVGLLRARRIPDMPAVCEGVRCTVLPPGTFPDDAGEPALRIAMLGDSLLAGDGAPNAEAALPMQLGRLLASTLQAPVHVDNYGRSGARAADVRRLQVPELLAAPERPDVVLLFVGANDTTHMTPPWRYASDLAEAVSFVHRVTGAQILLPGLPDFGSVPWLTLPLRTTFCRYAERLHRVQRGLAATHPGVVFTDLKAQVGQRFRREPELFADDCFHPSAAGYACIAEVLAPALLAAHSEVEPVDVPAESPASWNISVAS